MDKARREFERAYWGNRLLSGEAKHARDAVIELLDALDEMESGRAFAKVSSALRARMDELAAEERISGEWKERAERAEAECDEARKMATRYRNLHPDSRNNTLPWEQDDE